MHFIFTLLLLPILLPFMLLRMLFGLLGISTHILLIPLKFFARHTVLCLVVAAVVILYLAIKRDPHSVDSLKPNPTAAKQAKARPGNVPPLVEPVAKYEDGDSAFATDVYVTMTDIERAEYSRAFYQTMSRVPDGQSQLWSYHNIHGSLQPTSTFKNKQGVTCRGFAEVLKVHRIQQTISGTACAKADGSWCKLKSNATPACGLGHEAGPFEGITRAVKNLF